MTNLRRTFIFSGLTAFLILGGVVNFASAQVGNSTVTNGTLAVYADVYHGKSTASGEKYDRAAYTAAHLSLPFGSIVRVANFETGRMVDVRINDRKGDDGRLVNLSRAAADYLGLAPNRVTAGSLMVINGSHANQATSYRAAPSSAPAGRSQSVRPVRPLGNLFGGAVAGGAASGGAVAGPRVNTGGGIPPADYDYPDPHSFANTPQIPAAPRYSGGGTAAVSPPMAQTTYGQYQGSMASPAQTMAPTTSTVKPTAVTAATPYRVQFGAFQNPTSAHELAQSIGRAGIGATVAQAPGSTLFVVLSGGGFRSAADANRWIDQEGSLRGWRERPLVVR
jgi:rare lipoprotein A